MVRASGLALRLAVAVAACALVVRGDEFDAPTPRPAASPAKPSASDGADPVSDEIWTTMTISATAFVALSLLFDLLRSHLWLFTLRALSRLSVKYRNSCGCATGTSRAAWAAAAGDAQHSLTVLVENVPLRYRSRVALQRKFDRLCGPGSVQSVHVMVGGLEHLNGLVGRRDRARAKLEDARSRRARLAALREGDYRARVLGTGAAPRERPSAVWFERFLHRQASAPPTADAAPRRRAAAPWPDPESAARSPPPSPAAPARATS
ncbi:hypothetical protein JL722_12786 [Aureococcus anophagefferens]|nr:hypothetical protein JL722_12786 [Aureococcus anophagefferens]